MKKNEINILLLIIVLISICSCKQKQQGNKETINEQAQLYQTDTIQISDSVFVRIIVNKKNEVIITTHTNKKSFCEIEIYSNGSLKSVKNMKGFVEKEISEGETACIHNIQILKLDEKGFTESYYLSKNFKEIASSIK